MNMAVCTSCTACIVALRIGCFGGAVSVHKPSMISEGKGADYTPALEEVAASRTLPARCE